MISSRTQQQCNCICSDANSRRLTSNEKSIHQKRSDIICTENMCNVSRCGISLVRMLSMSWCNQQTTIARTVARTCSQSQASTQLERGGHNPSKDLNPASLLLAIAPLILIYTKPSVLDTICYTPFAQQPGVPWNSDCTSTLAPIRPGRHQRKGVFLKGWGVGVRLAVARIFQLLECLT